MFLSGVPLRFWFKRLLMSSKQLSPQAWQLELSGGSLGWWLGECREAGPGLATSLHLWPEGTPALGVGREFSHRGPCIPWLNLSAELWMWRWCVFASCGRLLNGVWRQAAPFYLQHCAGSGAGCFSVSVVLAVRWCKACFPIRPKKPLYCLFKSAS